MCLVAVAWQVHPRYPLVLLGNRDEFHRRPAVPAGWWPEADHVFGGRDLQAGGSWLGVTRHGRVALVTNNPLRPPGVGHTRSRGALVREWLMGHGEAGAFLGAVERNVGHYAGFSLLVGTLDAGLEGFVTPAGSLGARWRLPAGVTAFSNSPREDPWPKALWLQQALDRYLGRPMPATGPDAEELLSLVARRMPVAEPDADTPGGRARVTPFVTGTDYGTRATTLILADERGGWRCIERRFASGGLPAGESHGSHSP
ncbi:MAG: NRDE family protein [Gammaproteobacteria bacterium]|nr:NRDE family protein [Gammaproteobacteria bacterium]